jgi:hypothetical protein
MPLALLALRDPFATFSSENGMDYWRSFKPMD